MKRSLKLLGVAALVALIPLAVAVGDDADAPTAADGAKAASAPEATAPTGSDRFLARFDLDGDGSVTWEEFQKVQSGFARLDADGNGAIDASDLAAARERRQEAPAARRGAGQGRRGARGRRAGPGMRGSWEMHGMVPQRGGRGGRGMHGMPGMGPQGGPRGMRGMPGMGPQGGPRGMHGMRRMGGKPGGCDGDCRCREQEQPAAPPQD